jgi:hypothetical protein
MEAVLAVSRKLRNPRRRGIHLDPRPLQDGASCPDASVNTDDNACLEYLTPFEFLHPTKEIVAALEPMAGLDPDLLVKITDAERAEVQKAWNARRARILPELDAPMRRGNVAMRMNHLLVLSSKKAVRAPSR